MRMRKMCKLENVQARKNAKKKNHKEVALSDYFLGINAEMHNIEEAEPFNEVMPKNSVLTEVPNITLKQVNNVARKVGLSTLVECDAPVRRDDIKVEEKFVPAATDSKTEGNTDVVKNSIKKKSKDGRH